MMWRAHRNTTRSFIIIYIILSIKNTLSSGSGETPRNPYPWDPFAGSGGLQINRDEMKATLEADLRQYFSDTRSPGTGGVGGYKAAARQYIKSVYESVAARNARFTFHTQTTDEQQLVNADSQNFVGILRGAKYDTSEDEIILLGAHYDTVPTTPGVDDNGSGIAALLEALRSLAGCTPSNTIMFLAFDLEEYYTPQAFNIGSQRFVNSYLIPEVLSGENAAKTFLGAYILDTIMNYDPRPHVQDVTPLQQAIAFVPDLQPLLDEFNQRNKTGDFLVLIGRETVEDNLYNTFASYFNLNEQNEKHRYYLGIPSTEWSVVSQFRDFLRSDHKIFWSKSNLPNGQVDLPALFITDTAEFRQSCVSGGPGTEGPACQMCYHAPCDSANRTIDDDNLRFLAATTEALARSLAEFGQCTFSNDTNAAVVINQPTGLCFQLAMLTLLFFIVSALKLAV